MDDTPTEAKRGSRSIAGSIAWLRSTQGRRVIVGILVVFAAIGVGFLVWLASKMTYVAWHGGYADIPRADAFDTAAKAAIGIVGIIGAGIATWRASVLERRLEHDKVEAVTAAERALQQRLDMRFGEAADLIGHTAEETRIAGLLSLERLLKEDHFADEHWTIVQLLVSFVLGKCGAQRLPSGQISPLRVKEEPDVTAEPVPPPRDAQVALTIIGRRPPGREKEGEVIDLSGAHLEGANLRGAHLEGADLQGVHLEGANLHKAHLDNALLDQAHLEGANLCFAQLRGVDLGWSHLNEAHFHGANLHGANLTPVHLEGANLSEADLSEANLNGAYLGGAVLRGADLRGANLKRAKNLTRKQLQSAKNVPEHAWDRVGGRESPEESGAHNAVTEAAEPAE